MGRKLLKILLIFSLLFSIYNFKEDINNSFIISFAQSQKDEDKPKEKIDYTKYCWNLYTLYRSDDDWKKDLKKFNEDMKELEHYSGKITKSKTHLLFGLGIKEKLDIKLNALSAYAKLKKDLNKHKVICKKYVEGIDDCFERLRQSTDEQDVVYYTLNYIKFRNPMVSDVITEILGGMF